ncbi:proteasome-associated ATPase [Corynebacterium pollutisoli]|uniref:AAA ATPase forming ring-shaped complexes n=1 Tax=Corynebacterium pollutisoli TaxID=1610489 RepID=A0A1X7JS51_9CORY|nr:proteasome ATPase [Corynebacterium pollutisoli]SMG30373.1 proteasome-associated ATPase [Corynebacterium pollutisoli]
MTNADTTDATALQREIRTLSSRNSKLSQLLKASRDKLKDLSAQIDALAEPASTYGVYLSGGVGRDAEVFTSGRLMRLKVSPNLNPEDLAPGALVRLGDGSIVVEACGFPDTGELGMLTERVEEGRALVANSTGEERLVRLAEPIATSARAGDTLLVDTKAGLAYERIPKTEVSQLSLEEVPDVTYADIGGLDEQIDQIRDAVELPFSHPDLYRSYRLNPPKGVLLYGPPGCGKTLIAKAVANSLSHRLGDGSASYFLNVKGPELLNKFVGETERRIRLIFERARELAGEGRPVIIFFDEMESIFRTRGSGVSSDMETTVVPQLLTELDGVENLANVIIIGATNREELIDPALLRPGRLDVKIRVQRPTRDGARDIFQRYLTDDVPHAEPVAELIEAGVEKLFAPRPFVELTLVDGEIEVLDYSDFVSGAMIANIVDRAKKLAIKDHLAGTSTAGVSRRHIEEAVAAEQNESEDLPNTANPDEWSRIAGRHGKRVVQARVIG